MPQFGYLVKGYTGEYETFTEWDVAIYFDEKAANQHVELINNLLRQYGCLYDKSKRCESPSREYEIKDLIRKELDPEFYMDYTGTGYEVVSRPLVRHVDEFKELFLGE